MNSTEGDIFDRLDDYICDKFQSLSDWLQDVTGKTCFWYAYVCIWCSTVLDIYNSTGHLKIYHILATAFGFVSANYAISCAESNTSVGRKTANPLRYYPRYRFFRLVFGVGGLIGNMWGVLAKPEEMMVRISFIFIFCLFYFLSCTPRPGSKYRAGKWIDAFADFVFGRLVPQGT